MPAFRVVLIEHGYANTDVEREIIERAGGEFIDAERLPIEDALALCDDADGIMFRRHEMTAERIGRFRKARVICRYGVGTDNVDIGAATARKIIVGHVPVYCVDDVSTHAIALLLACARKIVSTHKRVESGGWDVHRDDPIFRLAGKTLGIVGLGNIGRSVARKMSCWNLRLVATDPFCSAEEATALGVNLVDFDTLCSESDLITLHCPLLPETRHLIGEKAIGLMKRGVIIINTARGPVVDGAALLAGLESGRVAQAGLDVFEDEPLPMNSRIRSHPGIVVTDHTAWYSEESQIELQRKAAEVVATVCAGGLPGSLANPEVLRALGREKEWIPAQNMEWQLKRAAIALW